MQLPKETGVVSEWLVLGLAYGLYFSSKLFINLYSCSSPCIAFNLKLYKFQK